MSPGRRSAVAAPPYRFARAPDRAPWRCRSRARYRRGYCHRRKRTAGLRQESVCTAGPYIWTCRTPPKRICKLWFSRDLALVPPGACLIVDTPGEQDKCRLMRPLLRLLPYYRPYHRQTFVGLVLVIVSAGVGSVPPWLLRSAIDGMRANLPISRVAWLAAAIVGLALVAGIGHYWMRESLNGLSRRIEYDLRNDLFRHLTALDAAYYGRHRTGDVMARLTNDISAVRMASGPAIMYLANTVFGGLFAIGFMLRIDVRLTALALVPMIFLPLAAMVIGGEIHRRFEAVQDFFGRMTSMVQENLSGARIVRAYRQEDAEVGRFRAMGDEYLAKNMHLMRLDA